MIIALLAMAVVATPADSAVMRDALISDVTDRMLAGEDLPSDIDARLMHLSPADRLQALIFMRRSGMMIGPGWTPDRILAPAKTTGATP